MKTIHLSGVILLAACQLAWGAASKEMSEDYGEYVVEKGEIIEPEDIYEDDYVSSVDYNYPNPETTFGVQFYSGNRQVTSMGQEEVFLIAIQGRRFTYEDLPTMNHVFVIDKSGSMYQKDKMNWVKESFNFYLDSIRTKDFVSVVVFDDTARVLFPSTQMSNLHVRQRVRNAVNSIKPGGGSNLITGLQLAYKEVLSNYHEDYTNRVLFLTDGVGNAEELYEMAASYREVGVNVTSIGLGIDCDLDLIENLADWGGGSSRFISSKAKMEEIFGKDFGRMVIPAARDVELELYLLQNLNNVKTWGYHAEIEGRWDSYELQDKDPPAPYGIGIGPDGYVYITDDANSRIQMFDDDGNLITQWGKKGIKEWDRDDETRLDRSEGRFNQPRGVAADDKGFIYVADSGNFRIQKFDRKGNFIAQWGGPGSREAQFKQPSGVAVDTLGYVYVADSGNNRIQKFDGQGNFITQWGVFGSENGQFKNPLAVTTDAYSNVYVADFGNNRVQIFESDGTFIATRDTDGSGQEMVDPSSVVVDKDGNLYVSDSRSNLLKKFDIEGKFITKWGSFGRGDIPFGNLSALAVDRDGNVYTADSASSRIQMFDGNGAIMIKQPIRFSLPMVNLGDYETIVIKADIPKQESEGEKSIAQLEVAYTDMDGNRVKMKPIDLTVTFVDIEHPVSGISNATVLRAATMLRYAQMLKEIGYDYHQRDNTRMALEKTSYIKNVLHNTQDRLGEDSFEDEIALLEKYIRIIGTEAGLDDRETTKLIEDKGLTAVEDDRSLSDLLDSLFEEVLLDLRAREASNIALLGFGFPDNRNADLLDLLNETAESHLGSLDQYKLIDRDIVISMLDEEGVTLSDLMDTDRVLAAGSAISAHYLLTGTVIEMSDSIAIFCRVINVETALVESVGQVIVPRSEAVNDLL